IPCSFTHPDTFKPKHAIWFECGLTCSYVIRSIFSSNNQNVLARYKKRVALLDSDWAMTKNCSIIINDLTEQDTGSYMFRVTDGRSGLTYNFETKVNVTALSQKPTVTSPQLTEGQQTTLTCTAPGHCSGSPPEIIWKWRGTGETSSHVVSNTSTETVVSQKYSSTLTFTPSAKHHGIKVACWVSFLSRFTTEETVTLVVTYVKMPTITGNASVKEGEALTLTCSADSHPPSLITWMKLHSEEYLQNGTETATLVIPNVTAEHSGQYVCTARHLNTTLTASASVTVMYVKMPTITGNASVKEGEALTLTCSADSHPPSLITWMKVDSEEYLQNGTETATLVIPNVTAEHSGQYVCIACHFNRVLTASANVTVMCEYMAPICLDSKYVSDVLTCVCISLGVPLPSIKWPLLESQAEYSITTTMSSFTVNSTIILPVRELDNTTVECVSSSAMSSCFNQLQLMLTATLVVSLPAPIIGVVTDDFPLIWEKVSNRILKHMNDTCDKVEQTFQAVQSSRKELLEKVASTESQSSMSSDLLVQSCLKLLAIKVLMSWRQQMRKLGGRGAVK
uniref:B-cell receptor CD22 n=1 Tax=Myripristis murdjan TaxID=586833 RepID=A0A668A651_9TELE